MNKRGVFGNVCIYAAALLLGLSILAPLYWLFVMSISSSRELTELPLHWFPHEPDFSRYVRLFTISEGGASRDFLYAMRNSIIVALSSTAIAFAVGVPAAYSFSRFPGRMGLLYGVLVTYMMPPVALILPLYMVFSWLGLLNSQWALIIVYCTILIPFVTWLLKSGFDAVPEEIEHAAQVDGANLWQTLVYVSLPVASAALGTAALFAILLVWDEFFYALLYTSDIRSKTLPVAIGDFAAGRATDYGIVSAVGVLAALPPMIAGIFLQKSLIAGLASGSVKG